MCAFYDEKPEGDLRFGDVIIGFQGVVPQLHRPGPVESGWSMSVEITRHPYYAVMTPCCSIKNKTISLSPLVPIRPHLEKNPYFWEDLLRINSRASQDKITPPNEWTKLTPEQKAQAIAEGNVYAILDTFVYAPHNLLAQYDLKLQATKVIRVGHYAVEFGSMFRVDCELIKRAQAAPAGIKHLQLDVRAREELRQKIGFYFSRVPDEDRPYL